MPRGVGTEKPIDVFGFIRYNMNIERGLTGLIMHHKDGVTPVTESILSEFDFLLPLSWTKEKIVSKMQPLMEITQYELIRLETGLKVVAKAGNSLKFI